MKDKTFACTRLSQGSNTLADLLAKHIGQNKGRIQDAGARMKGNICDPSVAGRQGLTAVRFH